MTGPARPGSDRAPQVPSRRTPRWGLRTLAFLLLAFVAAWTASALGGYTVGAAGSLLLGLGGAAVCSVRGVREALRRGPTLLQRPPDARRRL